MKGSIISTFLALTALLLLSACGGGGGSSTPDGDTLQPDGDETEIEETDGADPEEETPADGDDAEADPALETDPDREELSDESDEIIPDGDTGESDALDEEERDAPEETPEETDGDAGEADEPAENPDEDADTPDQAEIEEESTGPVECLADATLEWPLTDYEGELEFAAGNYNALCGHTAFPGHEKVYLLAAEEGDLLDILVEPVNAPTLNLALIVTQDCSEGGACLGMSDAGLAGENERLRVRAPQTGTLALLVDSVDEDTLGAFRLSVALGEPGLTPVGDACSSDSDCAAEEAGRGYCVGTPQVGFYACSLVCATDADCATAGFLSGCCREIPQFGGRACMVAAYCGAEGETQTPGGTCGASYAPNAPMCDLDDSAMCLENGQAEGESHPYCTDRCAVVGDCGGAFAQGCCINTGFPGSQPGVCLLAGDCPGPVAPDEAIERANLPITLNGDLSGRPNKIHPLGCFSGGAGGSDATYRIWLTAGERLTAGVIARPERSGALRFNPFLYMPVQGGWTHDASACLTQANQYGYGHGETIHFTAPADDYYFITVDATSLLPRDGAFGLELSLLPPEEEEEVSDGDDEIAEIDLDPDPDEEPGDSVDPDDAPDLDDADPADPDETPVGGCGNIVPLASLPVSGLPGDTRTSANSLFDFCHSIDQTPGPDLVYSFTLASGDHLWAQAVPTGAWNPVLKLHSACSDAACLAGADNGLSGMTETLAYTATQTGVYFLSIDSVGAGGAFSLSVSNDGPPADGDAETEPEAEESFCSAEEVVAFASLPQSYNGDTQGAGNDLTIGPGQSSCDPWTYASEEQTLSIDLEGGQGIRIELTNVAESFDPALIVTLDCRKGTDCMGGKDANGAGQGETLEFTAPFTSTYFLVVDSAVEGSVGAYTLNVSAL